MPLITTSAIERSNASKNVSMGFNTVMCLTSELFHVNRKMNVEINITNMNIKISVIASEEFLVLLSSLIIIIHVNIFF